MFQPAIGLQWGQRAQMRVWDVGLSLGEATGNRQEFVHLEGTWHGNRQEWSSSATVASTFW